MRRDTRVGTISGSSAFFCTVRGGVIGRAGLRVTRVWLLDCCTTSTTDSVTALLAGRPRDLDLDRAAGFLAADLERDRDLTGLFLALLGDLVRLGLFLALLGDFGRLGVLTGEYDCK